MTDITPKEAIANLNHLYGFVSPDIQRSLDVAIKALENPTGDLISREALKTAIEDHFDNLDAYFPSAFIKEIDNAPPVLAYTEDDMNGATVDGYDVAKRQYERPQDNQIAWKKGYECGYHQAKEDIAKRIKDQYNEHHELIPYWLSIGDVKGGVE